MLGNALESKVTRRQRKFDGENAPDFPLAADATAQAETLNAQAAPATYMDSSFIFDGNSAFTGNSGFNPSTIGSVHNFSDPNNFLMSTDYFTSFLDGIAWPDLSFMSAYQPLPVFSPDTQLPTPEQVSSQTDLAQNSAAVAEEQSLSRYGSRLPSLQPEETLPEKLSTPRVKAARFGRITNEDRARVLASMREYGNVIPASTSLPSRHALQRFVSAYFAVFQEHFPMLHVPSLAMETINLELFLAICALGAIYCRERYKAVELYGISKAIALEHLRRFEIERSTEGVPQISGQQLPNHTPHSVLIETTREDLLATAQALMLNIALAMWSEATPPAKEALSLQSPLKRLIHHKWFEVPRQTDSLGWNDWIQLESVRRTKVFVYSFFNLLTIVFDVPPIAMFANLDIEMPGSETIWRADTEAKWRELIAKSRPPLALQDAWKQLFTKDEPSSRSLPHFSTLGGYVLVHQAIQQIWFVQQSLRMPLQMETTLPLAQTAMFEHALRRWRQAFERGKETSIDPMHPHGRLAFNATALLRLAYIRINIDSGSVRSFDTWNPERIATSLLQSSAVSRSEKMTRAALHCAHGLSVPIKLGVSFVAHTQVFFWSNQHALCSLECALLLTKWLEVVTVPNPNPPLDREEAKLLNFIIQMVAETEYDAPREKLLATNRTLSAIVVRIWAQLFRSDSIWELVDLIGQSLRRFADMLET